jgi:predicted enzyme related to lactoylglutathione lyase
MTGDPHVPARIALYVVDPPTAATFYERVAGLRSEVVDGYVVLRSSAYELVLVPAATDDADAAPAAEPPTAREDVPVKLGFVVPSIAVARAEATRVGGRVKDESAEWEWQGRRHCDGVDPEGTVVQLQELLAE